MHIIDIGTSSNAVSNTVINQLKTAANFCSQKASDASKPIAGALATIWAGYHVYSISANLYDRYVSKDDAKLLAKLTEKDCGGLSNMSPRIEGCYKQYLAEAIFRLARTPSPVTGDFYKRFAECFNERSEHPCSWLGEDVFSKK